MSIYDYEGSVIFYSDEEMFVFLADEKHAQRLKMSYEISCCYLSDIRNAYLHEVAYNAKCQVEKQYRLDKFNLQPKRNQD